MQAPVFGERAIYSPGDAPKAVRPTISTASRLADGRLEKGIRKESAQAHEIGIHDEKRIVEGFILPFTLAVSGLHKLLNCARMFLRGSGPKPRPFLPP